MAKASRQFIYENEVVWLEEKKGKISASQRPDLVVATPAEFHGHSGIWTPEDFLVASVNSCIMTTFLFFAYRQGLRFRSFRSRAQGVLERTDLGFMFSRIKVKVFLKIEAQETIEQAEAAVKAAEKDCLISRSLKSEVTVEPEIVKEE